MTHRQRDRWPPEVWQTAGDYLAAMVITGGVLWALWEAACAYRR